MGNHILIFPIYTVAFEFLSLNKSGSPKEKGKKGLFKSPGSHSSWVGEGLGTTGSSTTKMAARFCACTFVTRSSDQCSEHRSLIFWEHLLFFFFAHCGLYKVHACTLEELLVACHGLGGAWVEVTVLKTELDPR
jgi:hypothetical protein